MKSPSRRASPNGRATPNPRSAAAPARGKQRPSDASRKSGG
jgi:hypothetical protein